MEPLEPCWRVLEPEEVLEVGFELDEVCRGVSQKVISVLHIIRVPLQQGLEAGVGARRPVPEVELSGRKGCFDLGRLQPEHPLKDP